MFILKTTGPQLLHAKTQEAFIEARVKIFCGFEITVVGRHIVEIDLSVSLGNGPVNKQSGWYHISVNKFAGGILRQILGGDGFQVRNDSNIRLKMPQKTLQKRVLFFKGDQLKCFRTLALPLA